MATPKLKLLYNFLHQHLRISSELYFAILNPSRHLAGFLRQGSNHRDANTYTRQDKHRNKKFWEELIAYSPLIRQGPHRKRRVQHLVLLLLRLYSLQQERYQALPNNDTHTDAQTAR
jgi:hypothetical protein